MAKITREEVLEYHCLAGKPGKIAILPTKPMSTQRDPSLAYTPGVAVPVEEIERSPELSYEYTAKGNLVAVVSNGTAILGLGDRGALASKPVMEGKAVLFKKFADVDVFDIEVNTHDPQVVIQVVAAIAPTFGGINLEDIKAPECFFIEESLKEMLDIPVFHDDQHGTAIISGAALLNGLELVGKPIGEARIVISGAGASAISCADLMVRLGASKANITLVDTRGVVYKGRTEGMNPYKERIAADTDARTLADAVRLVLEESDEYRVSIDGRFAVWRSQDAGSPGERPGHRPHPAWHRSPRSRPANRRRSARHRQHRHCGCDGRYQQTASIKAIALRIPRSTRNDTLKGDVHSYWVD